MSFCGGLVMETVAIFMFLFGLIFTCNERLNWINVIGLVMLLISVYILRGNEK